MKLSDYYQEALPLTVANFIKLQKNKHVDFKAFEQFCARMIKEGGYGALQ